MLKTGHPSNNPEQGWRECYRTHAPRLLLYARQWLPERADAEDAVQAGFVKYWRHKPHPQRPDIPLLFTAVRTAALDMIKRNQRRAKRETAVMVDKDDVWWDASSVEETERAENLHSALATLDQPQREAVVLRIWADMTFADIARMTNESINTIASRYRYALANLKKLIPEDFHERA